MISEVRAMWDEWDLRDGERDDTLTFDAFYNGFMAPYFGCYRSVWNSVGFSSPYCAQHTTVRVTLTLLALLENVLSFEICLPSCKSEKNEKIQ